jgi:hypothetical protein
MKEHRIDVEKFRNDPDSSLVTSFMMANNDIERLVYLRELHQKHNHQHKVGSFEFSIRGYTANLLIAHVYEAYYVLRQIKDRGRPIEAAIMANANMKDAYDKACAYIDDTKDSVTNESPYDVLLRKWKNLRNFVVFHYNPDEDKIPSGLKKVADTHKTSVVLEGEGNEPTFHELAYEVIDAVASDTLAYTYGSADAVDQMVKDLEPMILAIRRFAHFLILEYAAKYSA